jgi:hypothetical protein
MLVPYGAPRALTAVSISAIMVLVILCSSRFQDGCNWGAGGFIVDSSELLAITGTGMQSFRKQRRHTSIGGILTTVLGRVP